MYRHNFWGAPVTQPATTKFGTKVVTATYYRSDCENSLYYRTSHDHGLYGSTSCCISQCPMHYPVKFDADIFIRSGVIDIFQIIWIWPFRRVDSVVFERCIKFGSNICYSHWDRHTYASDIHLMTSRELTSGFHVVISVMHLPIKFGAYIFIQSRVIDIFPKSKMQPPSWIFRLC